jgi:hypothetical protein
LLAAEQRREFFEAGYLRLRGVLAPQTADAMRCHLWQRLAHNGADPNDRSTWSPDKATSLQAIRAGDPAPGDSLLIRETLDDVFGEGAWVEPKHWGQALVTFPCGEEWTLPTRLWHLDYPYWFPTHAVWGANLFLFVGDVAPRGGGTLVVRSSHRVIARFVAGVEGVRARKQKVLRQMFAAHHKWFQDLTGDPSGDRVGRFMARATDVDGIGVRVVELTGRAGDAVVCHPWLLHAGSPNALHTARLMRVCRIHRKQRAPVIS